MTVNDSGTKALVFDVFGTVVDWHGSVAREVRALARARGLRVNAAKFAATWRAGYRPAMDRVLRGEAPFQKIDVIHRAILEDVLKQFRITTLTEDEKAHLNLAWHRLKPWPDTVRGLKRLKSRFVIATLSNGNTSLLVNMAKHGGLPWDCVFSSDTFKLFKPDPGMYLGAADMLGLKPEEVMMVAAHKPDLRAAAKCGLKTAFVQRPREHGSGGAPDLAPEPDFTVNAGSFLDLAEQLGC